MTRFGGVVVACAVLGSLAAPGVRSTDPAPPVRGENPDDPPAPISRAEQVRTPRAIVVRGNHRSIQVNVDALQNNVVGDAANEPSLAVDPLDPLRMAIGWRQFDSVASNFRQAGWAYTVDGGEHWTFPGVLQPGQFRSDPVLASDASGIFYYYSLSTTTSAEMFRSTNGGVSWVGPIPALGGDKTWMAINKTGGAGHGQIYTIWNTSFTCCAPGTDFTRSIDGGQTYDGPFGMSSHVYWGTVDVGNSGEVYVVGVSGSGHAVVKSTDVSIPFSVPTFQTRAMSLGGATVFGAPVNPGGLAGQSWLAVDHSNLPTRGNVYVLGSVSRNPDPLDVMFTRSTNGGTTWTAPLRVNDDPPSSLASQWFATMSVAPNGRLDVAWNDTRNDPAGIVSEVFYAWSNDAGTTWSHGLPVTPAWNPTVGYPNQNKIGDYYHMVSDVDGAGLAYAATFNGEQDVYFLRLGDCNDNGQHDSLDLPPGGASEDCDLNRVPDECQENFQCHGPDSDGDGSPDTLDCAPADPTAFGVPAEVANDRMGPDKATLTWTSQLQTAGTGTRYDIVRGDPALLPVSSDPGVVCLATGVADPTFGDLDTPAPGQGFYYLVRAGNACATAGWGLQSNFQPRLTFVCDPP